MDDVFREKIRTYDLQDLGSSSFLRLLRLARREGRLTELLLLAESDHSGPEQKGESNPLGTSSI